jgi:hypothetical protein
MVEWQAMKTLLKFGGVLVVLLLVLSACNINKQSVRWTVDQTDLSTPPFVTVDYTVWNDGDYDLTGVKLEIGVFITTILPAGDYFSVWTPEFSLGKGDTPTSDTITFNISPYNVADIDGYAEVLGVQMDRPTD